MRCVSLLLLGLSMLASLAGCHAVTGRCDCVDLPPAVIPPPPVHPAPSHAPIVTGVSALPQAAAMPMPAKVEGPKELPVTPEQTNSEPQGVPDFRNK